MFSNTMVIPCLQKYCFQMFFGSLGLVQPSQILKQGSKVSLNCHMFDFINFTLIVNTGNILSFPYFDSVLMFFSFSIFQIFWKHFIFYYHISLIKFNHVTCCDLYDSLFYVEIRKTDFYLFGCSVGFILKAGQFML